MTYARRFLADRSDDALAAAAALLIALVGANALYAVKSLAGIDLLPGHAGTWFPMGSAIYHAFR